MRPSGPCSGSSGPYARAVPVAAIGDDISNFFGAVGDFFGRLAEIRPISLLIGLTFFGLYLTIRSRAYFHVLRAAYPDEPIAFRRVWGAYIAAYGFNNVIPARGGDIIKLFLVKNSIPGASYSAVGASFFVEVIYDGVMGVFILAFAFSQGVFPKPPDFAKLNAFDLSFFAAHPRFTLFVLTVLAAAGLVGFALLSRRVRAFWARVRQGVAILRDRRRYMREVFAVQFGGWLCRFTAFWFLLEAFNIGGAGKKVLLFLGGNAGAGAGAFSPRGAGGEQAVLLKGFAGVAGAAAPAPPSV